MIEPTRQDLPPPRRPLANLRHDVPASLVAFASGAPVVAGLVAAVVGGVVAGAAGGSPLQVSGPAAGLTVIVAETIDRFGWTTMCAVTVLAGVVQVLLGLSRVARAALAISPAIVHGMLAGIGITIVLAQLHVVFGGDTDTAPLDNLLALPHQIVHAHGPATLVGLLTLGLLVVWGRLPSAVRRVPGPLAAVLAATVLAVAAGMPVDRVDVPSNLLRLDLAPTFPDGEWAAFAVAVLTIALVASVESLLSAVAVDKLHNGPRADLNRELIGQGTANIVSGGLGGLPVTGVIVRGSTNVRSGARTRAAAVLHGVWIFLFVVLLAGLLREIPLAALAGLLVYIGARLVDPAHIKEVVRHGDLAVYLATTVGVVVIDLLAGVLIGIGVAALLTLRRLLWAGIRAEADGDGWRIVVEGTLAALSNPRLTSVLASIPRGATVTLELAVDYLDHAAFDTLHSWQLAHERAGGTVFVEELGHPWFARGKAGAPTVHRGHAEPAVPTQRTGPPDSALRRGAAEYQRRVARLVRPTLRRLADVHAPQTMFLTCGDARIVPNVITASGPGDLFTVRNIGNLVPAGQDNSVAAAVEFAVGSLGVREIAVCGHSSCGAMRALVAGPSADAPALRSWLRHAEPSLRRAGTHPPPTVDGQVPDTEWDRLALHNVVAQLDRLREHPTVAAAVRRGELQLTGMYFDVAVARIHLYDADTGGFVAAGTGSARPAAFPRHTGDTT